MSRIPSLEQDRIKDLEMELRVLKDELGQAREAIRRDRERIQQLNSQSCMNSGNYDHDVEIRRLSSWIAQLQHDFDGLLNSRRWKLGDSIARIIRGDFKRKQKPAARLHASQVFTEFETWKQRMDASGSPDLFQEPKKTASQMMEQLEKAISALSESTRYRAGKALLGIPGFVFTRGKPRLAMDHMMEIFRDYHAARKQDGTVSPELMVCWIEQLRDVFESFLESTRWKLGCRLAAVLEVLMLREKKPSAVTYVLEMFADFERGEYIIPGFQARRITTENDPSPDGQ